MQPLLAINKCVNNYIAIAYPLRCPIGITTFSEVGGKRGLTCVWHEDGAVETRAQQHQSDLQVPPDAQKATVKQRGNSCDWKRNQCRRRDNAGRVLRRWRMAGTDAPGG
jgi:hypothetical protein